MALAWFYMAAAALGGAGMLWHEVKKQKEEQATDDKQSPDKRKRRKQLLVATFSAAALIPQCELQQLQTLLHKVYEWRGWPGGAYHVTQAWHAAEAAAATAAAGAWEHDFDLKQMTDDNCNALLCVIDQTFFGGKMLKYLAAKQKRNQQQHHRTANCSLAGASQNSSSGSGIAGSTCSSTGAGYSCSRGCSTAAAALSSTSSGDPAGNSLSHATVKADSRTAGHSHCSSNGISTCAIAQGSSSPADGSSTASSSSSSRNNKNSRVTCKVVEWYGPTDTWLAYFDESNVIFINNWRWIRKHITPEHPLNVEGVVCTNRLQMLLHTLAHELVHAVVFHAFPEMDKSSPAYLENDRHGPIFQLLNKQLFGHSSDALERVQLLEARR